MTVIVIAKAPQPGRSKTRLSPPLTLEAAAALAEASLRDTLSCVARVRAIRRVVALDGEPGPCRYCATSTASTTRVRSRASRHARSSPQL